MPRYFHQFIQSKWLSARLPLPQYIGYWGYGWYPKTIIEFERSFTTEQSCQEYLYRIRWPEGFVYPHCNHRKYWITKGRYRCKRCRYWISATAGTIFQDTRIPLQVWFLAIGQVVSQKHGISALGLQHVLG